MRGSSTTTLGTVFATFVHLTASSWPTAASAFVIQGPSVHPTACRHYEQRQQRRLPVSDDRTSSPYSSCFLPRKLHQKTLPTTARHSGSSGVVGSGIHRRRHSRVRVRSVAAGKGVAGGSGGWRWRTSSFPRPSSLLMMGGAGEGGGGAEAEVESGLMLFNTEGRTKQRFRPQDSRRVKFYSCGPTVYDMAHIGNFRAFLTYDVLKRWLLYQGFEVDHVCNLTDVDDKIIARMARDGVSLEELTGKYAKLFFDDLASLNIVPASRYPRATEHIDDIVEMVQGLVDKELAYEVNGSVYFRVSKHRKYGTLACLDKAGMEDGAGEGGGVSDAAEFGSEKEDAKDFALWKGYKPEDGEVFWDTPLGKGRPGWHIECSAMARKFLGDTLDVHAGGIDLVFPHHENEVAQSEGFTGKPFCRCWVHNAFVNVDGEKMSKSKGNFLTLKSTLTTALDVRAFRYLVVSSQYRTTLGFSMKSLESAKNTLQRLDKLRAALEAAAAAENEEKGNNSSEVSPELLEVVPKSLDGFDAGMNDDLNTPRAAASLFAVVKAGENALKRVRSANANVGDAAAAGGSPPQSLLPQVDAKYLLTALDRMDSVFGIFYEPAGYEAANAGGSNRGDGEEADLPEEMAELLARRLAARENKDWATADAVRDEIKALGYSVKDVKGKDPVVSRI